MLPPELRATRTRDLGPLLRARFGQRVRKICLRLGTTCPNRDGKVGRGGCIFCAEQEGPQGSALATLERSLATQTMGGPIIAYLQDHSATYLPAEDLDRVLERIRLLPALVGVHIGTRPDCLPPPVLEVLRRHGAATEILVELGLQSAKEETLEHIGRRHSLECFGLAVQALQEIQVKTCAHVIMGLPTADGSCEGSQAAITTAEYLATLGISAVKIHNCHVLQGTALAALHARGDYTPPDLEGYLERLIPFIEHLPATVEIHRLVGEARPPRLIAPEFTVDKGRNIHRIRQELIRRDTWQGRLA